MMHTKGFKNNFVQHLINEHYLPNKLRVKIIMRRSMEVVKYSKKYQNILNRTMAMLISILASINQKF